MAASAININCARHGASVHSFNTRRYTLHMCVLYAYTCMIIRAISDVSYFVAWLCLIYSFCIFMHIFIYTYIVYIQHQCLYILYIYIHDQKVDK